MATIGLALLCAPASRAQSFEVASIKVSSPGSRGMTIHRYPGRITVRNAPVRYLIQFAYEMQDFQILDGSRSLTPRTYDVDATTPMNAQQRDIRLMMRFLLADRFHLTIRRETKELPVYFLTTSIKGPKLRESKAPKEQQYSTAGFGVIQAKGMPMVQLAGTLSNILGRSVADKTGLTGTYDYELSWTPDESQAQRNEPGTLETMREAIAQAIGLSGPSLFTALQESLGLRLQSGRGPVEVLVVDHIEQPSPN
jgi:uncharacterized protein (TIGR03435 family)